MQRYELKRLSEKGRELASRSSFSSFQAGGLTAKQREALHQRAVKAVEEHIRDGLYSRDNIEYVRKLSLLPVREELKVSREKFEQIQALCRLWDIGIRDVYIRSHRKYLGPFIVLLKRIFYRAAVPFLRPVFHQQKLFNAAVISCLIRALNEKE